MEKIKFTQILVVILLISAFSTVANATVWQTMFRGYLNRSESFTVERNWAKKRDYMRVIYHHFLRPGRILETRIKEDNRSFAWLEAEFMGKTIKIHIIYNPLFAKDSTLQLASGKIVKLRRVKDRHFKTIASGLINRSYFVDIERYRASNNKSVYRLVYRHFLGIGKVIPLRVKENDEIDALVLEEPDYGEFPEMLVQISKDGESFAKSIDWHVSLELK